MEEVVDYLQKFTIVLKNFDTISQVNPSKTFDELAYTSLDVIELCVNVDNDFSYPLLSKYSEQEVLKLTLEELAEDIINSNK